jgi:hypothetical protein
MHFEGMRMPHEELEPLGGCVKGAVAFSLYSNVESGSSQSVVWI